MTFLVGIGAFLERTRPDCLGVLDLCSRKGAWPELTDEQTAWASP